MTNETKASAKKIDNLEMKDDMQYQFTSKRGSQQSGNARMQGWKGWKKTPITTPIDRDQVSKLDVAILFSFSF